MVATNNNNRTSTNKVALLLLMMMMTLLGPRVSVAFRGPAIAVSTRQSTTGRIQRPFSIIRPSLAHHVHIMTSLYSSTSTSTSTSTPDQEDTIFALSSSGGSLHYQATALAVIRISGPRALSTLQSMLKSHRTIVPRQATLCKLYQPTTTSTTSTSTTNTNDNNNKRVVLDHALVLYFPHPHSFTGDNVVELHCHGGRAVVTDVLRVLSTLPGHRMAEPGEFTQRAFAAGKLDLMQVEALADLLTADTSRQRQQALTQLDGTLSLCYAQWRNTLIRGLAHAEAVIDFGDDEALLLLGEEEEDEDPDQDDDTQLQQQQQQQWNIWGQVREQMNVLRQEMEFHLQDSRRGELVREGLRIAIVGPPNAGKSSLFNVLAQKDAAIVSNIAGTTRDVLELSLNLAGIKCILSDTAGVRTIPNEDENDAINNNDIIIDVIEQEGILRAKKAAQQADIVVAMVEQGDEQHGTEIIKTVLSERTLSNTDHNSNNRHDRYDAESSNRLFDPDNVLLVLNKMDLKGTKNDGDDGDDDHNATTASLGAAIRTFKVSCHTNQGIDTFLEALTQTVTNRVNGGTKDDDSPSPSEGSLITRARHRQHVQAAVEALRRFDSLSQQGSMVVDMAAEELRLAASELGRVTGAVDVEDILDVLFKDFCIGK
jgi:tRNA modification GTPase